MDSGSRLPKSVLESNTLCIGLKGTPPTAALSQPQVLDSGSDPKRELRYHFKVGQTQFVHSRLVAQIKTKDPNNDGTYFMARLDERLRVVSVSDDGSASFEFEELDGHRPVPEPRGFVAYSACKKDSMSRDVAGARGAGVIDTRGVLHSFEVSIRDRKLDKANALLFGLCIGDELPQQPVGPGATWQPRTSGWLVTLRSTGRDNDDELEYTGVLDTKGEPQTREAVGQGVSPTSTHGSDDTLIDLSNVAVFHQLTWDQHYDSVRPPGSSQRIEFDIESHTECWVSDAP